MTGNFFSDLLGELSEKFKKQEEDSAKRRENVEVFKKSLEKLAKKHGFMYFASITDGNCMANTSNIDEENHKELGFEDLHDFGNVTLKLGRRIAEAGVNVSCIGIDAIHDHKFMNPEEVKLPEEPCANCSKPIYNHDGKQIGEYEIGIDPAKEWADTTTTTIYKKS